MTTPAMNETLIQAPPASRREGTVMASKRSKKRLISACVAIAGLTGGAMAAHADTFAQRAASGASQDLSVVPPPTWPSIATTCESDCTITLDAGLGSVVVADSVNGPQTIPFLGFNVNGAGGGEHTLAGGATSTIKVPLGTTLTIESSQDPSITDPIELSFPSLGVGDVSHTGSTYTVHADTLGTSVFQPGTNASAPRQVASGLVGTLIVTPVGCPSCAYDETHYADEAIVATTDLDAEFAASPTTFDMSYFGQPRDVDDAPRRVYHLINGRSFPDTDVIDARAGDSVLVRYVNAGVIDKSMGLLGLRQVLLARNASRYTDPQTLIAPLVGPGETADVAVTVPAGAPAGQRYSLVDQARQMNHGTASGFGGALTFLNVWAGTPPPPPPVVVPPVVDSASFAAPDQLTINASSTVANITAAEVSIGATAAVAGSGTAVLDGTFGAPIYSNTTTLNPAPLDGDTVWVRAEDSNGVWSDARAVTIVIPVVLPPVVVQPIVDSASYTAPDQITIDASSTVANITAAEVSIGVVAAAAGSGTAVLDGTFGAPSYSNTTTLSPVPSSGDIVWVRVEDSNGVWSEPVAVTIP
jgi:hypothetical protein